MEDLDITDEELIGVTEEDAYDLLCEGEINYKQYENIVERINKSKNKKFKDLPQQSLHINDVVSSLMQNPFHLDTSQMGSGKTYTTCMIAKDLKSVILPVCPINAAETWFDHCNALGVKLAGITNYEKLIRGMWWDFRKKKDKSIIFDKKGHSTIPYYDPELKQWDLVTDSKESFLIVFDEAHKLKNKDTINYAVAASLRNYILELKETHPEVRIYVLYLSATPIEKLSNWGSFFYLLGKTNDTDISSVKRVVGSEKAEDVYNYMKKNSMTTRMVTHITDFTNDIQVIRQEVDDESASFIEKEYSIPQEEREKMVRIAQLIKENQLVELIKAQEVIFPYILEKLYDYQYSRKKAKKSFDLPDKDYSIIVFFNYKESINIVKDLLEKEFNRIGFDNEIMTIYGDNTNSQNTKNAATFNSGSSRVILCTYAAGSASISLHDTVGDKPRYVILSPTMNVTLLIQALGRAYRVGLKSNVKQRIIFLTNEKLETTEDTMATLIEKKLDYIKESVEGEANKLKPLSQDRKQVSDDFSHIKDDNYDDY